MGGVDVDGGAFGQYNTFVGEDETAGQARIWYGGGIMFGVGVVDPFYLGGVA